MCVLHQQGQEEIVMPLTGTVDSGGGGIEYHQPAESSMDLCNPLIG